jgi:uncharacterized protein (TIGR02466 family)
MNSIENRCWYTPIFETKLEDFNQKMYLDEVDQLMSRDVGGRVVSNVGGWQSKDMFLGDNPVFDVLFDKIQFFIDNAFQYLNTPTIIDNYWINVNNRGDQNKVHCHPNSLFSGVIYLSASPDQGELVFNNPGSDQTLFGIQTLQFVEYVKFHMNPITIIPDTSKVVLFPSFVYHSVNPNLTDRVRISLSFNTYHKRAQ